MIETRAHSLVLTTVVAVGHIIRTVAFVMQCAVCIFSIQKASQRRKAAGKAWRWVGYSRLDHAEEEE